MYNFYELLNLIESQKQAGGAWQPSDSLDSSDTRSQQKTQLDALTQTPNALKPPAGAKPVTATQPVIQRPGHDPEEYLSRPIGGTRSTKQGVSKRSAPINRSLDKDQQNIARMGDKLGNLNRFLTDASGEKTGWLTQAWTVATALAEVLGEPSFAKEEFFMTPYNLRYGKTGGAPYLLQKGTPNMVVLSDPKLIDKIITKSWNYIKDPRNKPEDWELNQRIRKGSKITGETGSRPINYHDLLKLDKSPESKIAMNIGSILSDFINDEGYSKEDMSQLIQKIADRLEISPQSALEGFKKLRSVAPHIMKKDEEGNWHITTHVPFLGDEEDELAKNRGGRGATNKPKASTQIFGSPKVKKTGAGHELRKISQRLVYNLKKALLNKEQNAITDKLKDEFLDKYNDLLGKHDEDRVNTFVHGGVEEMENLLNDYEAISQVAKEWTELHEAMCNM